MCYKKVLFLKCVLRKKNEEEKYSDKELLFNIIVFSSNSHTTALRIFSKFCVKWHWGFQWEESFKCLNNEVPININIYFLPSSPVSTSAHWLCPSLTGLTTNLMLGSIQCAELNVWGWNGLNSWLLLNVHLLFFTSSQLRWDEFGRNFSSEVIIEFCSFLVRYKTRFLRLISWYLLSLLVENTLESTFENIHFHFIKLKTHFRLKESTDMIAKYNVWFLIRSWIKKYKALRTIY